jgi:hypothetical protein
MRLLDGDAFVRRDYRSGDLENANGAKTKKRTSREPITQEDNLKRGS